MLSKPNRKSGAAVIESPTAMASSAWGATAAIVCSRVTSTAGIGEEHQRDRGRQQRRSSSRASARPDYAGEPDDFFARFFTGPFWASSYTRISVSAVVCTASRYSEVSPR